MKKLFCLIALLLVSSFMFGATVWLPRIHVTQSGCGDWIKFEEPEKYAQLRARQMAYQKEWYKRKKEAGV